MNSKSQSAGIFLSFIFTFLIGVLLPKSSIVAEEFSVVLHGQEDFPPYFFKEGDSFKGFYSDFFDALGQKMGDHFSFHDVPFTRSLLMFETSQVDIEPGVNPEWRAREKVPGLYTVPYAQSIDILLFAPGKRIPVSAPEDLEGKRIGVIRGYQYPSFTQFFQSGAILRVDMTKESQLLGMLELGRLDQIIINKYLALYQMKQHPDYKNFEVGYEVSSVDIMLRIHPNKAEALPRFNNAIKQLIDSGTIEQIWEKYR
ncbi:substrate-binding periplasmic protein [Zooshikella harenae]|uniref:Transporter substrate-binding domain-containing protein n=1 Tax=Zooshikella harenae TaxID=2827238 RepID=A0ABS5ZFR7_9GAMM|nr:transporter substrate-binding domain-containing protein [Zooshikella harenae]MBU2712911.1 transporter substrate-binding domain-containing protein [Zooshikella harenae]